MKKIYFIAIFIILLSNIACAKNNIKQLPTPIVKGGMPLLEAIDDRHSSREFSAKKLDDQILSEVLWSAFGKSKS